MILLGEPDALEAWTEVMLSEEVLVTCKHTQIPVRTHCRTNMTQG